MGLGNPPTQRALYNFCSSLKPSFLCIAKPKVSFQFIHHSFWRSLNLSFVASTSTLLPNLWILVSNDIGAGNVSIFSSSTQHITVQCSLPSHTQFITCVYGNVLASVRRHLWTELEFISSLILDS